MLVVGRSHVFRWFVDVSVKKTDLVLLLELLVINLLGIASHKLLVHHLGLTLFALISNTDIVLTRERGKVLFCITVEAKLVVLDLHLLKHWQTLKLILHNFVCLLINFPSNFLFLFNINFPSDFLLFLIYILIKLIQFCWWWTLRIIKTYLSWIIVTILIYLSDKLKLKRVFTIVCIVKLYLAF